MIKIGIAGCGGMGITHLSALKALSKEFDCKVTAAADCRKERLALADEIIKGLIHYDCAEQMIQNAELDAVFITLPTYCHCEAAVAAMEKGMDVFIEKPVCLTKEEGALLLKTEARTRRAVMVGHVIRFAPEYAFLKEVHDSGRYGKLNILVKKRLGGKPGWSYQNWFLDPRKSGTVVLDLLIHDADFIRYLLGEPEGFSVQANREADGMISQAIVGFDYPVVVSAEALWSCAPGYPFQMGYRAEFEKAAVLYDSAAEQPLLVYSDSGESGSPLLTAELAEQGKGTGINVSSLGIYYLEDRYFIESLLFNRPMVKSSLCEGVASAELMLRVLEKYR